MSAELVDFRAPIALQPATMLRKLADDIEKGVYGQPGCVAVAMLADRLEVFSAGPDSAGPSAATTLNAGALMLTMALVDHGK